MTITWTPAVYKLDASVDFPHWALAACTDEKGVTHYSRVAQQKYAHDAFLHAKDFAAILTDGKVTPEREGTTFGNDALPPGRLMTAAEINAAPRLTSEEFMKNFMAELAPPEPSKAKKPRGPRG